MRLPAHFACRVGDHPLARVSLHPPLEGYLQPGAALAGTVDLRQSHDAAESQPNAPKCVAVAVTLETEERVEESWRQPRRPLTDSIRKVTALPCAGPWTSKATQGDCFAMAAMPVQSMQFACSSL